MTVKFLGEVKDDDVNGICDAVQSAAAASSGFDLTVEGCGCFPPRGGVRIVWAGLNEPTGALLSCVEGLETALAEIGFPREGRAFSPHITIGRVKFDESGGAIRRVVDRHTFPSARQSVDSLTLMSSVLSPTGPTYTSIGRFSFKP